MLLESSHSSNPLIMPSPHKSEHGNIVIELQVVH